MAYHSQSSLLSLILLLTILTATTQVTMAGRQVPAPEDVNVKHPEWFLGHDGSMLIPGIGRVMVPSLGGFSIPTYGSVGGGGSYIPGADDTFVPNPGFEVPNPAGGGGVPFANNP